MIDGAYKEKVYSESELRARAIYFDRMDRREFTFPQSATLSFDLLTLTERELNGGVITGVGIDSPQWDFFDDGLYLFQKQRYVWSIIIQGLTGAPATGFRVVNLFIRTRGYLFR